MKAYENEEFIHAPEGRIVRVLSEFLEPQRRLKREKIEDTIVFFGSARTISRALAQERIKIAEGKIKNEGESEANKKLMARAKKTLRMCDYYDDAVELSRRMTEWSQALSDKHKKRFIVCSGGGPGMMEAANRGAVEKAKGLSVGFTISMPEKREPANPFISDGLEFEFHYFFMRKYWFTYLAKALVIFPGGFGTLDELMEILTLKQTKKIKKEMPIVIYGSEYWNDIIHFDHFVEWGTISDTDRDLFKIVDTVDSAFEHLTTELERIYLS